MKGDFMKIDENRICMVKGDTGYLNINLHYDNGNNYVIHEGDKITFFFFFSIYDSDYALQKNVNAGEVIAINPEDTQNLTSGDYVYDVQLDTTLGEVFTVAYGELQIIEGVTQ